MKAGLRSSTATLIAAATVLYAHGRNPAEAPPAGAAAWCERLLSTRRADRWLLRSVRFGPGKSFWKFIEWICAPGVAAHWMRRKRCIDRLARDACDEGFSQLIVLGAGLDTLALRMSEERVYQHVISADHPATLSTVRAATRDLTMPIGLEFLELDLSHEGFDRTLLGAHTFDRQRNTVIVLEGVLMYLQPSAVMRIIRSLAALPLPRIRLIASWMHAERGESIGFRGQSRLVPAWLRRNREPMLWASSPALLPPMLQDLGWQTAATIDLSKIEPALQHGTKRIEGEHLVIADRYCDQS